MGRECVTQHSRLVILLELRDAAILCVAFAALKSVTVSLTALPLIVCASFWLKIMSTPVVPMSISFLPVPTFTVITIGNVTLPSLQIEGVLVGVSVGGTGVLVGVLVGVSVGGTGVLVGVLVGVSVGADRCIGGCIGRCVGWCDSAVLVGVLVGVGVSVAVGSAPVKQAASNLKVLRPSLCAITRTLTAPVGAVPCRVYWVTRGAVLSLSTS